MAEGGGHPFPQNAGADNGCHNRHRPHLGGGHVAGVRWRNCYIRHQRRDVHLHHHTSSAGPLRPPAPRSGAPFRLIREEPEEPGVYLDFEWDEHAPYGTVRRDLIGGNLYTPIKEAGVTLYEPHYTHLVPSVQAL